MAPVLDELLDFLQGGKSFLIAGHLEPDGDCIGSQLALASVLQRMGKETVLCSPGPFKRTEIKKFESLFTTKPQPKEGDRLILLDCSSLERTGDLEALLKGLPTGLIDHHETGNLNNKNSLMGGPLYIDVKAPSTTYLVLKIIEGLGLVPTVNEAEYIFFGLCTDTGFFRHVDSTGENTFLAAAKLIAYGANPKAAFADIHGGKSLDSRKLLGHILIRSESFFDGKLILSSEKLEETKLYGLEGRDSDSLYQLLQSVDGVEALVVIRQESPEFCTVGFRSRDSLDVGKIAQSLGGGGHKNAAGLKINGNIDQIKETILALFKTELSPVVTK